MQHTHKYWVKCYFYLTILYQLFQWIRRKFIYNNFPSLCILGLSLPCRMHQYQWYFSRKYVFFFKFFFLLLDFTNLTDYVNAVILSSRYNLFTPRTFPCKGKPAVFRVSLVCNYPYSGSGLISCWSGAGMRWARGGGWGIQRWGWEQPQSHARERERASQPCAWNEGFFSCYKDMDA